jgi:hypothetical protein
MIALVRCPQDPRPEQLAASNRGGSPRAWLALFWAKAVTFQQSSLWNAGNIARLVLSNRLFDVIVIVVATFLVVGCSVVQGAYNLDPHHWGVMTSNAVDMARGRVPYKEMFIQYGFLTAFIQYLFFKLGNNIASIIFGVSLLYALGLVGIYLLTLHLVKSRRVALYAFLTAFLIHPLVIYPWPNYVAFPFITFGCLCVVKGKSDWRIGFLGGVLLGGAVLAREGLFLALAPALVALAQINFWCSRDRSSAMLRFLPIMGFILALGLFAFYLQASGLTYYWRQTAIELPRLYMPIFINHGPVTGLWALLKYVFQVSLSEHARQTVFATIILSALAFWVRALIWRKSPGDTGLLFVALVTGLLLSSALHLNEIFRLATSITVGLGLVFILVDRLRLAGPLFAVIALALVVGTFGRDNGDYFLPSRALIKATTTSNRIGLFVGQRWSQDVFDYYDWYVEAMRVLETRACGLRYFENETRDAFLEALAPFMQYQLAPFGSGMHDVPLNEWSRRLRPDYDLNERLKARDILVVAIQKASAAEEHAAPDGHRVFNPYIAPQQAPLERTPPEGYRIFARRITPKSWFLPDGLVTLLIAPAKCGEMPAKGDSPRA